MEPTNPNNNVELNRENQKPEPQVSKEVKDYSFDPDVELMLRVKEGDNASFEQLMHKYYSRILNFNYRFVRDKESAEDLTQEVFVKVFKAAKSYSPNAKFKTWLYTIAKNTSLNELRKSKRISYSIDDPVSGSEGNMERQVADENAEAPDQSALKKEMAKKIKEAIESLPQNQKMAVILLRYEKFSYDEIAKALNTSVSAVKSLLSRAKENLRNGLTEYVDI